ncbi:MAG TPA: sulfotransferase [Casimicrobiaceae bacterium]|nr:sulfotransferase [Casimicrobiaceae bacterium]
MPSADPQTLFREAVRLERAGRPAEAEAAYERLLAQWPDHPDSWYNLAVLQRRTGRFEDALASYGQALAHGISRPEEVHLNRGVIFSDCLRRDQEAEKELRTALALNPRYAPALFNLANLMTDLGERESAIAAYERLLAVDPQSAEGLARYADLKPVATPADPLVHRLREAMARPGATAADKASLGFALGRALDGCGAYDQAFAAYAAANRCSRASAPPNAVLYDRRRQEALVDELIATFTPDRGPYTAPGPPARPIFICGMFRSGSTLTEQVLAGHSKLRAGGELDFIPGLARTTLAPFPARMTDVSPAQLAELSARYLADLEALYPGASHVTDKRPDNFLYLGLVKRLFPAARIVHTTRDPVDNCLSIYFLHIDHSMGHALDLLDTAHYYRHYRRLMRHWKSLFGADILDFDYDEFVRAPRPAVERLLAFCGLDWEDGCMAFHRVRNAVKTASAWQVREPLYRHASGRARNYERHLGALRAELADLEDGG